MKADEIDPGILQGLFLCDNFRLWFFFGTPNLCLSQKNSLQV